MTQIEEKLAVLSRQPFRAKFHLSPREQTVLDRKGLEGVRHDARTLLAARLFVADPRNDGRQTPFGNHPVFVAQHATATCCRGCLSKWHGIPKHRELSPEEQAYVVNLLEAWIIRQAALLQ